MAIKMRWHGMHFECPECKQEATINSVATAGDGQILFDLLCIKCGINLQAVTTIAKLVAKAVIADMEELRDESHRGPIHPMLKEPLWTPEDKKFEHDMGIDPDKEDDRDAKNDG